MFELTSGVLQGCALSDRLWALCVDPLPRHLQRPSPALDHAAVRACADDIGLILLCASQLAMIAETSSLAEMLAGLALQPARCVAAPLRAPFPPEVQSRARRDLERA
eukprot:1526853-Pyramimonas_sp.AAC.1